MNLTIRQLVAASCVLLFSNTSSVLSQDLTLVVKGTNPRFRSQAPIPLELTLNWNSSKLIEGTLKLEVRDAGSLLLKYENPDIAMVFGDSIQRIVLPPIANESDSLDIKATFESLNWGSYELGRHSVKVPADWKRQLLIGLVTPDGESAVKGGFGYVDRISLDRYRPGESPVNAAMKASDEMDVINVRFSSRELPARAAPMCAYDVLVLAADSVQELREPQRQALLNWVDAGGSVLVDASGSVTEKECDFLNELADRTLGENAFILDAANKLISSADLVLARHGFGRVVVTGKGPAAFSDEEAFQVTCWLWKVREDAQSRIAADGKWAQLIVKKREQSFDFDDAAAMGYVEDEISNVSMLLPPYAPNPLPGGTTLPTSLLPSSVQVVPLPIVMCVLCLFLLVIAPGDWLLLGRLKKRMLTWLFFPAMCVLFTGIMILLAYQYIGKEDYRTAIHFVDWSAADRVSRVTDVETLFTSTAAPVEMKLSNQLFAPVNTHGTIDWQGAVAGESATTYVNMTRLDEGTDAPTPTIIGKPATLYSVRLPLRKWSPTVSRYTGFGVDVDTAPAVDWLDIDSNLVFSAAEDLVARLEVANPGAAVVVLQADRRTKPRGSDSRTKGFLNLAIEASAQASDGLFSVVSMLSPNGHESLEDLAIRDKSNADEATVLVVFGAEGDVIVHRRMFYRDGAATP